MAVTVTETWASRATSEGDDPQIELTHVIEGTDSDITAKAAYDSALSSTYDGLVIQGYDIERVSQDAWLGKAHYGRRKREPDTGDSTYQFETAGGTQHISHSLSTIGSYAASGVTPTDHKGAIGVHDGQIDGVDIQTPVYNFSETHYLAVATVTSGYKATLYGLTGKVNSDSFRGFAAGEVLFLGAEGTQRGEDDWEITYRFAALPNATSIAIGSEITVTAKKGWEYLWVEYEQVVDATANRIATRPLHAYVEQVYETAAFSGLGI